MFVYIPLHLGIFVDICQQTRVLRPLLFRNDVIGCCCCSPVQISSCFYFATIYVGTYDIVNADTGSSIGVNRSGDS